MVGQLFFLKIFYAVSSSNLIFSISVYEPGLFSFIKFILFFLISSNLNGSAVNPTTHKALGFFNNFLGIELLFMIGMLQVLYPLFAN